jgi:homocysteine S-methyltransferase
VTRVAKYRHKLPQLGDERFLTDGGLETTLIYLEGVDLLDFAAFPLLADEVGIGRLEQYYESYMTIARQAGVGFIAEAATWRASSRWGERLGYGRDQLADLNRKGISVLATRRVRVHGWSSIRVERLHRSRRRRLQPVGLRGT